MTVTVIDDHGEAKLFFAALDPDGRMKPEFGNSCAALVRFETPKGNVFVVLDNKRGSYSAHIIENATEEEAKAYAKPIISPPNMNVKPRIVEP